MQTEPLPSRMIGPQMRVALSVKILIYSIPLHPFLFLPLSLLLHLGACPPIWVLLTALSRHSSAWLSFLWTQSQGQTQILVPQWTLFNICPTPQLHPRTICNRPFWEAIILSAPSLEHGYGWWWALQELFFFLFKKPENFVMQSKSTQWPPIFSLW